MARKEMISWVRPRYFKNAPGPLSQFCRHSVDFSRCLARCAFVSDAICGLCFSRRRRTFTRRIERTPKCGGSTLQALNRENAAVDKALWVLGCSRCDVGRGDG